LTNLAGTPLVKRAVGGAGGGGAVLTEAGLQLLQAADAMAQARGAVLSRWQAEPHAGPAVARLAVRTSMRNQWPCVVQGVQVHGQIVLVHLGLAAVAAHAPVSDVPEGRLREGHSLGGGAAFLAARITRESSELLGLQPGLPVQALCKATAVRVERVERATRGGAESQADANASMGAGAYRLPAKAVRVARGALGDEVAAELMLRGHATGVQMVGFAPPASGVRVGSRVELVVEDTAVVLALSGL
jgi:molybdate transport system regulatory protein